MGLKTAPECRLLKVKLGGVEWPPWCSIGKNAETVESVLAWTLTTTPPCTVFSRAMATPIRFWNGLWM